MGLFEKQGISQNTPRTLAAHKCDIKRETRAITDDTLKKVMVNLRARLKRVMDKKGAKLILGSRIKDSWEGSLKFLQFIFIDVFMWVSLSFNNI